MRAKGQAKKSEFFGHKNKKQRRQYMNDLKSKMIEVFDAPTKNKLQPV